MNTESTELVVMQNNDVFVLPEISTLKTELDMVRKFQATVKELLIEGHDYGIIPGTDKPTLLKPGAEKIDKILKLADTYEEVEKIEDWDKPLFYYKFKCRLNIIGTDIVVSEGWGSCNSMESKYRYRWVFYSQLPAEYQGDTNKAARSSLVTRTIKTRNGMVKQYRLDNEDIYSLANTILKMAKKRAHIDASLSAGRLSDVFTQDIEDLADMDTVVEHEPSAIATQSKPASAPQEEAGKASAPTSEASTPEQEGSVDLAALEFKNPGEFYTACLKQFKLSKTQADKEISMYDLTNPGQRKKAWQEIVAIYGQKEG